MASGGARRNSGPAPDPSALRRDRKDDAEWTTLPVGGYAGEVPEFPLPKATWFTTYFEGREKVSEPDAVETQEVWDAELELWGTLWRKPQAAQWKALGMEFEVAAYVRAFLESVRSEASAGLKTAVLRMAAEIGLSLPGMHSLRWRFGVDELAKRREATAPVVAVPSARARLAALKNGT